MSLVDLAVELGLNPRKTSVCRGGEYHCPCPECGGKDRFMFWPEQDRYWCRQCQAKGDSIQFCRDFLGLSFHAAAIKAQKSPGNRHEPFKPCIEVSTAKISSTTWQDKALRFVDNAHDRLLIDPAARDMVTKRGLSLNSIKQNRLGYHPISAFNLRLDWGLEEKETGKWIYLPQGIVIPMFEGNTVSKLKIRKADWQAGDPYGKYYELPGSSNILPFFGDPLLEICIVVEAEFDGMLVIQEAGDLCNCIALGGVGKRPHQALHEWMLTTRAVFFALDFDDAGKKEYFYWKNRYPNLKPWPVPEEKSPGDYFQKGGNLRTWVQSGMKNLNR